MIFRIILSFSFSLSLTHSIFRTCTHCSIKVYFYQKHTICHRKFFALFFPLLLHSALFWRCPTCFSTTSTFFYHLLILCSLPTFIALALYFSHNMVFLGIERNRKESNSRKAACNHYYCHYVQFIGLILDN